MMSEQRLLKELEEAEKIGRMLEKSEQLKAENAKKALGLLRTLQKNLDRNTVTRVGKT